MKEKVGNGFSNIPACEFFMPEVMPFSVDDRSTKKVSEGNSSKNKARGRRLDTDTVPRGKPGLNSRERQTKSRSRHPQLKSRMDEGCDQSITVGSSAVFASRVGK
jgi:hypothetical protein